MAIRLIISLIFSSNKYFSYYRHYNAYDWAKVNGGIGFSGSSWLNPLKMFVLFPWLSSRGRDRCWLPKSWNMSFLSDDLRDRMPKSCISLSKFDYFETKGISIPSISLLLPFYFLIGSPLICEFMIKNEKNIIKFNILI